LRRNEHQPIELAALMLFLEMAGHELDEVLFCGLMQIAARLDRMARRRGAFLCSRRTIATEVMGTLVQLRCDEAGHSPKFSALIALDETSPAAIGDDVPNLRMHHGASSSLLTDRAH